MKLYAKIKVIVFLLIWSRSVSFYTQFKAADVHCNFFFLSFFNVVLSPATNILYKSQLAYRNVVSLVFLSYNWQPSLFVSKCVYIQYRNACL